MTVPALSLSSPSPAPELVSSSDSTRTNTLVIASLPPHFFEPYILDTLRTHFSSFGEICSWVPIKAFARAIVIFYSEDAAELAKLACDNLVISPEIVLRVYRADPTPLALLETNNTDRFLRPPEHEKNFLISPPGSPPVGWEPIREDAPNNATLADDLVVALRKLQIQQGGKSGIEVLLEPEEGAGIGVYVEDCDAVSEDMEEQDWLYGETRPSQLQWKPMPTAMPPRSISV